jgi:hypothetical protein
MVRRWCWAFLLIGWPGLSPGAEIARDLALIHVEAMGGREALEGLRAVRAIGYTDFGQKRMRFVMWAERPNRIRVEAIDPERTQTQAWDGKAPPWRQSRGNAGRGAPERMSQVEARMFTTDADFDDALVDALRRGGAIDYAGRDTLGGRPVVKLLVTRDLTRQTTVWLDAENYLILRSDSIRRMADDRETRIETRFLDYRAVAGVLFPHRLVVTANGQPWLETILEQVDANPLLPPGFFTMPGS